MGLATVLKIKPVIGCYTPRRLALQHRVENRQHTGRQRQLLRLPRLTFKLRHELLARTHWTPPRDMLSQFKSVCQIWATSGIALQHLSMRGGPACRFVVRLSPVFVRPFGESDLK